MQTIDKFGTEESARIGAADDLANLLQEGTRPAATARTVLERYWPNRLAIEELEQKEIELHLYLPRPHINTTTNPSLAQRNVDNAASRHIHRKAVCAPCTHSDHVKPSADRRPSIDPQATTFPRPFQF